MRLNTDTKAAAAWRRAGRITAVFLLVIAGAGYSNAQQSTRYNWSGRDLPVFRSASATSAAIGTLKAGEKVTVSPVPDAPFFKLVVGNYGDITQVHGGDMYGDVKPEKWTYDLSQPWVRINFSKGTGYLPAQFLSSIPFKKTGKEDGGYGSFLNALTALFNNPVKTVKRELEKQSPEEINRVISYTFSNRATYSFGESYAEEGGAGGDSHTLFVPGISLHEAMLLILTLADVEDYSFEKKSVNKIKSIYDTFFWLYNTDPTDEEGKKADAKKNLRFYKYAEGGGSSLDFNIQDNGVEIIYTYGGC